MGVSEDVNPEATVDSVVFLHLHTLLLAAETVTLNFLNGSHYFVTVFQASIDELHFATHTPSVAWRLKISSQAKHLVEESEHWVQG